MSLKKWPPKSVEETVMTYISHEIACMNPDVDVCLEVTCPEGQVCESGQCRCPDGSTHYPPAGIVNCTSEYYSD